MMAQSINSKLRSWRLRQDLTLHKTCAQWPFGTGNLPIDWLTVECMKDALEEAIREAGLRCMLPNHAVRKAQRECAGVTQKQLAMVLGVTAAAVSRWESGKRNHRCQYIATYVRALDRLARATLASPETHLGVRE